MKTFKGDMFKYLGRADAICVTTNGIIKHNGKAVMGAGCAKTARDTLIGIDSALAKHLKANGNVVGYIWRYKTASKETKIFSFPTKNDYRNKSDINLIIQSAKQLMKLIDKYNCKHVILPRPGCSCGGLSWNYVRQQIEPILDDRVYIIY